MNQPALIRISSMATRSDHRRSVAIDSALIAAKAADAALSPRKRDIHIFHTGDGDNLHRMLNALQPASYVTPHRHADPPKSESLILLQGRLACIQFDDHGRPDKAASILLDIDRGVIGVDYRPAVWHTIFALAPDTVVFEVKPGPYDPATDKGFAAWAPREGDAEAAAYLMALEDRFRTLWGLPRRPWV